MKKILILKSSNQAAITYLNFTKSKNMDFKLSKD